MTKVLILHSGGFDSAAALRHLLAQQTDVLAVHVNLNYTRAMRSTVMRYWTQEQWSWLQDDGFTFDTMVIENPDVVQDAPYYVTLLKAAATLFNADPTLTHIMSGRCAEDATSPTRDWDDGWALFETITGKTRDQVRVLSPFREQTKAQAAATLPEDFIELLWGCFRPFRFRQDDPADLEEFMQCDTCPNCETYRSAGIWETVYWLKPPPIPDGPFPIPDRDWFALRPDTVQTD